MSDLNEKVSSVMKHGLMLAEEAEELVTDYHGENVEEELIDCSKNMINNCDDPERTRRIIGLTANLSDRLGSEKVARFALQAKEQWEEKYGQ